MSCVTVKVPKAVSPDQDIIFVIIMATKLIIFVCTSNTCRSPIAEQLAKEHLKNNNIEGFEIKSRSISTDYEPEGSPASPEGVEVMRRLYNIDMRAHRSKLITTPDIDAASKVRSTKLLSSIDLAPY